MNPGRWLLVAVLALSPTFAVAQKAPKRAQKPAAQKAPPAPPAAEQPPAEAPAAEQPAAEQPAAEAPAAEAPAAEAPAEQPAAEVPAPAPELPGQVDHREQLDGFGERLDGIEQKIALVASRVDLLRDVVLGDKIARSRATIVHRNDMGSAFVLERASYVLDGDVIFSKEDTSGALDEQRELVIFDGGLNPGEHEISVSMTFGGSSMGFFTYLKGYKFKVESRYRFMVADGKLTKVQVVSYAKDDITQKTGDKIAVRYDIEVGSVPAPAGAQPEASPATPAPAAEPAPAGTDAPSGTQP